MNTINSLCANLWFLVGANPFNHTLLNPWKIVTSYCLLLLLFSLRQILITMLIDNYFVSSWLLPKITVSNCHAVSLMQILYFLKCHMTQFAVSVTRKCLQICLLSLCLIIVINARLLLSYICLFVLYISLKCLSMPPRSA